MNHRHPIALFLCLFSNIIFAQNLAFDDLDIDSLMGSDVQLTSAMKRLQSARETPASVYVLSGQEIINAGVSSVPQALTLVPGMQVRQIDNNIWAISMRTVAGSYSSKLLVLVDGRSVYDPIHAGVNWQSLNLALFDIDRIEIIRGQGSLLWGSNATNGVVNIITKHSEDTRGIKLSVESGSEVEHNASIRYGDDLGELGSFRISGLSRHLSESSHSSRSISANDDSQSESLWARLDLNLKDDLFMLIQGQYQEQDIDSGIRFADPTTHKNESTTDEDRRRNYSFTSRIHQLVDSDTSQMLQVAYTGATSENLHFNETNHTLDLDFQRNTLFQTVQFDWGLNYRYAYLKLEETDYVSTDDGTYNMGQYGAFVQAQFAIVPDEVTFTLGNKSEHNAMTGWEHQPTAKLIWMPTPQHTLWASLSRGVRIPSLIEYNARLIIGGEEVSDLISGIDDSFDNLYVQQVIEGNEDVKAETSVSTELGYRYNSMDWSADLSLFYTQAKNVTALESSFDSDSIYSLNSALYAYYSGDSSALMDYLSSAVLTQSFITNVELDTYGGEFILAKQINDRIKGELGYSFTALNYSLPSENIITIGTNSILRQWLAKVSVSIGQNHTLYALARYEDGDAYYTDDFLAVDLSWSWQVNPQLTLGMTANNLFNGEYIAYADDDKTFTIPTYIEPTLTGRIMVKF
jgi:iron complex outermembrane receptor protein